MESVALEVESCHLPLGHLDALWIGVGVEFTADGQAGLGRGTGDQVDYGEAAGERRCAPVLRDVTEQAMLDLVPLCALPRCTDDVGANPTRQLSLQPEAPGADQEATNGLKHFGKRSLLGISGSYGPQHKPTPMRPEKDKGESHPASGTGRPPSSGKRARHAPVGLTGVKVAARMAEHQCATREVCPGDHGVATGGSTTDPRGSAPAWADGGWVRTTADAG